MVVTGKGYGQTNLVAIDAQGNILDEKQIEVTPTRSVLVVQRGDARSSYNCNPWCMPTVQLGDADTTFDDAGKQITTRIRWLRPRSPAVNRAGSGAALSPSGARESAFLSLARREPLRCAG